MFSNLRRGGFTSAFAEICPAAFRKSQTARESRPWLSKKASRTVEFLVLADRWCRRSKNRAGGDASRRGLQNGLPPLSAANRPVDRNPGGRHPSRATAASNRLPREHRGRIAAETLVPAALPTYP